MIGSKIQWTDATFNPWIGCAKVSAGCAHCYAEVQTFARIQRGNGRELWGLKATRHRTSPSYWKGPERWNSEAQAAGRRLRVFCASLCDVFEPREDLDRWRWELFQVIDRCPDLDWQLLTKRPESVMDGAPLVWTCCRWPANVWLGASIEDRRSLVRVDQLRKAPAPVRFLSIEPLLEDLGAVDLAGISWVIIGGESGRGARPLGIAWVRDLVAQCRAAGVPCFVKQLGSQPVDPEFGAIDLIDRKGGDIAEFPPDLRVREFPEVCR